jgi:riboflavin kinase/FMN adenylyltransferase
MHNATKYRLAVGVFDGVHLGHQKVLKGVDGVMTFSNHPHGVIGGFASAPPMIMSPEDRFLALKSLGIKDVRMIEFTKKLSAMSPDEFIEMLLSGRDKKDVIVVCGKDWKFGRGGAGDGAYLASCGIDVEIVDFKLENEEKISSSRIRELLSIGEVESANKLLFRPYSIKARVSPGKGEGKSLGCPTLNFRVNALVKGGVYAVEIDGAKAIANFGYAPTFGERAWKERVLEVHALSDFSMDDERIYEIAFLKFLRAEKKFSSKEELAAQIAEDIKQIN